MKQIIKLVVLPLIIIICFANCSPNKWDVYTSRILGLWKVTETAKGTNVSSPRIYEFFGNGSMIVFEGDNTNAKSFSGSYTVVLNKIEISYVSTTAESKINGLFYLKNDDNFFSGVLGRDPSNSNYGFIEAIRF
jgi:phage-related protein